MYNDHVPAETSQAVANCGTKLIRLLLDARGLSQSLGAESEGRTAITSTRAGEFLIAQRKGLALLVVVLGIMITSGEQMLLHRHMLCTKSIFTGLPKRKSVAKTL